MPSPASTEPSAFCSAACSGRRAASASSSERPRSTPSRCSCASASIASGGKGWGGRAIARASTIVHLRTEEPDASLASSGQLLYRDRDVERHPAPEPAEARALRDLEQAAAERARGDFGGVELGPGDLAGFIHPEVDRELRHARQ